MFNRPSFSFLRTVYPVQLRFFWDVPGFWLPFLQELRTPVRGRMSVTPLCWLAGWLQQNNPFAFLAASAQQDFFFFFHFYYFFLSFPENVISACFCQSTGVLCSLEWGSGPLKRTDKMASPTTPMCLRSREGRLWGHSSLDRVREQGVATLHVDHSQNLLHREKHRVRHSFHCRHTVCFKASSADD